MLMLYNKKERLIMCKIKSWESLILIPLAVCITTSCEQEDNYTISLQNNTGESLPNKGMVISRDRFDLNDDEYVMINNEGENMPIQFDDLDQDGIWDEAAFIYNLSPNEKVNLNFTKVKKEELAKYPSRANIYLGYSPERNNTFQSVTVNERPKDHKALSTPYLYQYEGPAWESDLVAFRIYFDSRNGKDIFGKTKPQLFADSIGLGEDYHSLQDWGMDILKVGSSLGAGSLALLKNDSLYQLTGTRDQKFETISDGPVRGIMKLTYKGWDVAEKEYDLEEIISIWGGKRWYESQVRLSGETASDTLVTGIVDLHDASRREINSDQWKIRYLHGEASENNDYLGMGILVPRENFAGFAEAPTEGEGILNTSLAYLVPSNQIYRYIFYVGWEGEDQQFKDQQYFEEQLIKEAELLNKEVEIKIKN
jgi:hypothetical protein